MSNYRIVADRLSGTRWRIKGDAKAMLGALLASAMAADDGFRRVVSCASGEVVSKGFRATGPDAWELDVEMPAGEGGKGDGGSP